ncbi:MAG: glycosyltransferase family 4 protein [Acidobacteria bacterium]|nr:glycosyltransferase family 4 protein [Acidobacteriota bacterium]
MRILLLTQLFQPEPNQLKGLDFARELERRGHEVEVLTGFPNYPKGRIYPGYRQKFLFKEFLSGISVIRVPVYPSHNRSGFARALCYLSFAVTSVFPGLFGIRRPDVVHVYQGPATLALPAMFLRLVLGVPYVLDIQDLWPDSVGSSGMMKAGWLMAILRAWSRLTYSLARRILVLSPGYKAALAGRGVEAQKVDIVYNWSDESPIAEPCGLERIRTRVRRDGFFNVVYAGNVGPVQALGSVIEAAEILERKGAKIRFVFVGDGADLDNLKNRARTLALTNIDFIPRQPRDLARGYIRVADAVLVHLKDDDLGRLGIPQKTQAYMAAGRPIIMAVRGDAAELVRKADAGFLCEPEDPVSIASAVERLSSLPEEERERYGRNGRDFYYENLSFRAGVERTLAAYRESVR